MINSHAYYYIHLHLKWYGWDVTYLIEVNVPLPDWVTFGDYRRGHIGEHVASLANEFIGKITPDGLDSPELVGLNIDFLRIIEGDPFPPDVTIMSRNYPIKVHDIDSITVKLENLNWSEFLAISTL